MRRERRVYRVTSVHERMNGTTYTRTRHFFTKSNALRSYNHLTKTMQAWNSDKPPNAQHFSLSFSNWGRPVDVRLDESEPLIFLADEEAFHNSA